jgi:hypothetical protein
MNFKEIQDVVIANTKRGDFLEAIKSRINATVNLFSSSGFYWPDLEEVSLGSADGISGTAFTQVIQLPVRFRRIAYLKYPTGAQTQDTEYLKGYAAQDLMQDAYKGLGDIYYVSGTSIKVKNSRTSSTFLLGYFTSPAPMVADADTNWITALMPYAIADQVTQFIMAATGNREEGGAYSSISQVELQMLIHGLMNSTATGAQHGI